MQKIELFPIFYTIYRRLLQICWSELFKSREKIFKSFEGRHLIDRIWIDQIRVVLQKGYILYV